MLIKIFTTGGSIDKVYSTQESAFVVGPPQVGRILEAAGVTIEVEVESLLRKDSLEITAADRDLIVERVSADSHRRIVITHGTDTMIETARALSAVDGSVIVLTGAMQPAAFKETDAAFNVGCALLAVQVLPEGVYIVMNGRVFDPLRAEKNVALDRFEDSTASVGL
ncbi:MAG: asparaginase domain-containing protein [Anaerolineae bacterium]